MKKGITQIVLASVLSLSSITWFGLNTTSAQTLKFSGVSLVSSVQTVPAGHVWKIESCLGPRTEASGANSSAPGQHLILVNGTSVSVAANGYATVDAYGGAGSKIEVCTTLPIWLPEGTTLAASTNVNYISVVDFEIVP